MGSSASKPEGASAGVLFQNTSIPISFGDRLADSLDSNTGDVKGSSARALEIESIVQQRVAEELAKIQQNERQELAKVTYQLGKDNLAREKKSSHGDLNAVILQQEIEELKRQVRRRSAAGDKSGGGNGDAVEDKAVENARSRVVACLMQNPGRSLDCHQEVDDFKLAVGKMQKAFIASLS